ncbi:hypothetical protein VNO77_00993 [Canavalia gladiata]|uniref:Uncharacterized protein n=1 Tax=Canavalia gladiata TaxID=3824 RepID=A0AAN9MWZ8_CANGL
MVKVRIQLICLDFWIGYHKIICLDKILSFIKHTLMHSSHLPSIIAPKIRIQQSSVNHTLVMFAIIGFASAADSAAAPADDYEMDDDDALIGTAGQGRAPSPHSVVAAPIGGPVPPGAFDTKASAPSAASSSLHKFSTVVAGAATAALAASLLCF